MNRRRALNAVHRRMAHQQDRGVNAVAWFKAQSFHQSTSDVPFERISIADLDRIAPRLVKPARAVCPDCLGAGEIIKADGNPNLPTRCEECHGRGYYTEAL